MARRCVAAASIVTLAAVNLAGLRFGIGTQVALLVVAVVVGLLCLVGAGLWIAVTGRSPADVAPSFDCRSRLRRSRSEAR